MTQTIYSSHILIYNICVCLGTQTINCFNEYGKLLQTIKDWTDETIIQIRKSAESDSNPILSTTIQEIEVFIESREQITDILKQYKTGNINKLELFEFTFPPNDEYELSKNTNNLVQALKTKYADAIRVYTNKVKVDSIAHYKDIMQFTEKVSWYFSNNFVYHLSGKMSIWRKPVANLERPMQIKDKGQAYWEIWDSTMPIAEFNEGSTQLIDNALTPYIESIISEINIFSFQLTDQEVSIQNDIHLIDVERKTYLETRELNSNFIQ